MYTPPSYPPTLAGRLNQAWLFIQARRSLIIGGITVLALLAFEVFNYTTTDFALTDLLGDMNFLGLRWAVILAVAFCGMDFAGIARLFSPERTQVPHTESWYLLGAWFLAAAMNALLTWWGVSLALLNHANLGNEILGRDVLLGIVPVFVATLVVLIRVLLIGTFTMAGERLLGKSEAARPATVAAAMRPAAPAPAPRPMPAPAPKTMRPSAPPPPDDVDWELDEPEPRRATPPKMVSRPPVPTPPAAQPLRPAPKPAPRPLTLPVEIGYEPNGNGHNGAEPR